MHYSNHIEPGMTKASIKEILGKIENIDELAWEKL